MKTVLTYVLSLSLLLMVGFRYVDRGSSVSGHSSNLPAKSLKTTVTETDQSLRLQKSTLNDDQQSVFSVEDEDESVSFSRRQVQIAGYFVALVYAAFILQSFNTHKKLLTPIGSLTYIGPQRYILQGALLI